MKFDNKADAYRASHLMRSLVKNTREAQHAKRVGESFSDSGCQALGYLHDVVEDGYATFKGVSGVLHDDEELLEALRLLTHDDFSPYEEYIKQIALSGNIYAIKVKIADLLDHFNPNFATDEFPEHKRAKYLIALGMLHIQLCELTKTKER